MVRCLKRDWNDAVREIVHPRSTRSPTSGVRSRSGSLLALLPRGTLLHSTLLRSTLLRNIARGSYLKFLRVRHMEALDISSDVQAFRAVVDGGVVGEAAGERLAEMVDGGVVGDEA